MLSLVIVLAIATLLLLYGVFVLGALCIQYSKDLSAVQSDCYECRKYVAYLQSQLNKAKGVATNERH